MTEIAGAGTFGVAATRSIPLQEQNVVDGAQELQRNPTTPQTNAGAVENQPTELGQPNATPDTDTDQNATAGGQRFINDEISLSDDATAALAQTDDGADTAPANDLNQTNDAQAVAQDSNDNVLAFPTNNAADDDVAIQSLSETDEVTNQTQRLENNTSEVSGNGDDRSEADRSLGQIVDQFA